MRALFSTDPASAVAAAAVLAGFGLAAGCLDVAATLIGQRAGARYILRMHELIGLRAARLPLGWFDTERTGPISHMVTRGVVFAANAPDTIWRPMLHGLLAPAVAAAAAVVIDWRLGLCLLSGVGLVAVVYRWTRARRDRWERAVDRHNEEGAARVLEFAAAQPAVRAAGPDSLAERSVRDALRAQRAATRAVEATRLRGMTLYNTATYVGMLLAVTVSVALVTGGGIDGPTFVGFLALAIVLGWLALHALPFDQGVDLATRALQELDTLLTAPVLPEPDHPARPADTSIEFDNVAFSYAPGTPILHGASFRVAPGSMTAVVGPSGSGKTTLARLIARFYDVDTGNIRIGGRDLRDLGTRRVLAQVSMVFQDVYLFEDTLRENIRLGRPDATDADVDQAAQRAGVTDMLARLPDGMDTIVGESGGTLSGGERQRVSIARALLKNAPIVLLDEATAGLDIDSEALVQRGLAELAGDSTLIVIAHRLQTIRHADQIVVLDGHGGIEAVGDHTTLLDHSPTYAAFCADRSHSHGWSLDAQ
ncbi:ABC transporter ATP-binding protein [Nocardia sp. NPDC050630]|uniref:ABC transporter ATP-binding protein n=1 Tax=Nocardia sp. NPDC050630 TaxID=3364321 RepID=UPI0037BA4752